MKFKFYVAILAAVSCVSIVSAQKSDATSEKAGRKADLIAARKEAMREKQEMKMGASAEASLTQSPYNDTDSFGKNVKFLGSLYAGTVYVYHTCDPLIFEQELGAPLAPDDKCIVYAPNASGGSTFEFYDPAWEIEIPKDTVENVIYPMLNNSIGFDSFTTPGTLPVTFFYIPKVTIVSDALNDPLAIDPNTGLPMNGSFTTTLAGSRTRSFNVATNDFLTDYQSYASVAGRGFSRGTLELLAYRTPSSTNFSKRK